MTDPVVDRSSNKPENLEHAAEEIGRSRQRLAVFKAIYRGKSPVKTVPHLMRVTGLKRTRVLDAGKHLADSDVVTQLKLDGVTAYRKVDFYRRHRDKVLRLVQRPDTRKRLATKRRPATAPNGRATTNSVRLQVTVRVPRARVLAKHITIDDIESFLRVRGIRAGDEYLKIPEKAFREGIQRILHRRTSFNDWGGEMRDLFDTNLRIAGKRRRVAFAFKGPGQRGILSPGKMGKNGDQIQRLARCAADVFLVQYWAEIGDSVLEQLEQLIQLRTFFQGQKMWYGIIDGADSARLIRAYPKEFAWQRD